jgi:cytochrome d ubiquinol oxidase subunit II
LAVLPLLAVVGLLSSGWFIWTKKSWAAWGASALFIVGAVLWGVGGLFPNLLPSSIDPAASLTAFNSSSSPLTLSIMLGVAGVMVPIVIAYQTWVYWHFRAPVTVKDLVDGESY